MNSMKTLSLAAIFAVSASALGLAQEESREFVYNYAPISGASSAITPATTDVPQTVTSAAPPQVPSSPWFAGRFNADRDTTFEEKWFLRAESPNAGAGGE